MIKFPPKSRVCTGGRDNRESSDGEEITEFSALKSNPQQEGANAGFICPDLGRLTREPHGEQLPPKNMEKR